jgi:hypothetical protein
MKVGTKSVLFGYHCVLIHWMFVARGWFALYGFSRVYIGHMTLHGVNPEGIPYPASFRKPVRTSLWDPRLWIVFLIHDLGYWGKPNMDGAEGERHPEWACGKLNAWFGEPWGAFSLLHSRFYAKKIKQPVSPLCYADKLAIVYMPAWLYLPMVHATGEVHEYMKDAQRMIESGGHPDSKAWLRDVKSYVVEWVATHKDGREDTWTPEGGQRDPLQQEGGTGVWK